MKRKLVLLSAAFVADLAGLVASTLAVFTGRVFVVGGLAVAALIIVSIIMGTWLRYVSRLVVTSSSSLHSTEKRANTLSFDNIQVLEENQRSIRKKFELSAHYIGRLGRGESLDTMDSLLREDTIGDALFQIKADMLRLKEEEDKRNWITEGLAKFGEILRNKAPLDEYANSIISNLVRYIKANQGGLFIAYQDDDGRYMEMAACYAYEKRKYMNYQIREGEGLLGQAMFEKDLVFLKQIPDGYVKITSGLGEATPRNLVIIPLIFNERFYGVIEIALFTVLEPYQLEFLRKVSANIASEIASIQSIASTQKLLNESKTLTNELQQREEEMQQNIEEMATIQEQMHRKQNELNSYMTAVSNTIASAEFDMQGHFTTANDIFLKVMGYSLNELSGLHYNRFMKEDTAVVMMWDNLREGKFFQGEFRMRDKTGKELWLSGTFNPIITGHGRAEKIIMFAQFTTQEKEKISDMTILVNAVKSTLPVVEFNSDFTCRTASDKFMKLFGFTRMTLKTKSLYDILPPAYLPIFEKIRPEILSRDFSSVLLPLVQNERTTTFEASISVAQHADGTIARMIMILVKEVEVVEEKVQITATA